MANPTGCKAKQRLGARERSNADESLAWFRPEKAAGRPLSRAIGKSPAARSGPDKWPSSPPCSPRRTAEQNSAYSASGWAFLVQGTALTYRVELIECCIPRGVAQLG